MVLLLQAQPSVAHLNADQAKQLTERIQNAGTEVVEAKVLLSVVPLTLPLTPSIKFLLRMIVPRTTIEIR